MQFASNRQRAARALVLSALALPLYSLPSNAIAQELDASREHAGSRKVADATPRAQGSIRPRIGLGIVLGAASAGFGFAAYAEGGIQITDRHSLSVRGMLGAVEAFSLCIAGCASGRDMSFAGASLMYGFTPVPWLELQGGLGFDGTKRDDYTPNWQNDLRFGPAFDARVAILVGGHGPGTRGAFEIGIAVHVSTIAYVVGLSLGFKLH